MAFSAPKDMRDPESWDFIAGVPSQITPEVLSFCEMLTGKMGKDISLEPKPVYIPVRPPLGFGRERVAMCYSCVDDCRVLGRIVHGYAIWELPGIILNAEHHAVLETENGLLDVTPQIKNEKRVLFLPVAFKQENHFGHVSLEFVALSEHPLIKGLIPLKYQLGELMWQSKAHTVQYQEIDHLCCQRIIRYKKIMAEREQKAKLRKQKKKRKKR